MRTGEISLAFVAVLGGPAVGVLPSSTKAKIVQFTRGAAVLAAAALLTGGLAACGEDEPIEPTSSTTVSPLPGDSTTTSGSSSESGSSSGSSSSGPSSDGVAPLPEAATKKTKAGAIAFNEFYWQQTGAALKSGDATTMQAYSDGCAVCDNIADQVSSNADKGVHMDSNPYATTNASGSKRADGGYRVELTVNIAEYSEVLKDGSKGRTAKSDSFTTVSDTQWSKGHWVVKDMVRVQ